MKLSTKTRYATRAMMELALHHQQGGLSTREIALEQRLSPKYLEHLLTSLRHASLIRSVRGAQGGHALARHPAEINLREIYEALEGSDGFVDCTTCADICDRTETCATREIWGDMYDASMQILESITLEDLTKRAEHKQAAQEVKYEI